MSENLLHPDVWFRERQCHACQCKSMATIYGCCSRHQEPKFKDSFFAKVARKQLKLAENFISKSLKKGGE